MVGEDSYIFCGRDSCSQVLGTVLNDIAKLHDMSGVDLTRCNFNGAKFYLENLIGLTAKWIEPENNMVAVVDFVCGVPVGRGSGTVSRCSHQTWQLISLLVNQMEKGASAQKIRDDYVFDPIGVNLSSTTLSDCNFTNADLRRTDLTGATLTNADLTGVIFTGADLTGANLTVPFKTGVELTGVIFTGATLTGPTGETGTT